MKHWVCDTDLPPLNGTTDDATVIPPTGGTEIVAQLLAVGDNSHCASGRP